MNVLQFLDNPSTDVYSSEYIVLDFETTNEDKGSALNPDNSIVLSAWSTGNNVNHKFGTEYELNELVQMCEERLLIAHNAKFELQWLKRAGCELTSVVVWDTYVA
jgi:DNA polymerase III epsilon subunit-like protein